MPDSPICKVCRQVLTGLDSVFDESGAGIVVTKCPRCHSIGHHIDAVSLAAFEKHANVLNDVKQSLSLIGPAVAAAGVWDLMVAYDTFKKVLRNTLRLQERQMSPLYNPFYSSGAKEASVKKQADDWADNHAFKPREEVEHVTNPNPVHFEDPENAKEVKVALSQVQEFLSAIIPHVVSYAMEKQDAEVLKALGHLGTVIREARKTWRMAREIEEQEYDRTYLAHPSADLSQFTQ